MNNPLTIENVNVNFNGFPILRDINLVLQENEFLGIIGPNGGGKTTLLKVILGLIQPTTGRIRIYGRLPLKSRKLIGYVPQYSLFEKDFPISVYDVVAMGRLGNKKLFRKLDSNDRDIIEESLARMQIQSIAGENVGNLSGGQKQRVLIARALASQPKILLLDEPTSSIDTKTGQSFYELLRELNEKISIILISHDIGVVSQYVKKIACLNKDLIFHDSKLITKEMLEKTYQCPVDLIAHGVPHRVLEEHKE